MDQGRFTLVPAGLRWWAGVPGGTEWLAALPELIAQCADAWRLDLEAPFEPATISWVAPGRLPEGTRVVLKINFPDAESEREATALECWDGRGAVRLIAHDPARRALVVERCVPGTALRTLPEEEALEVVCRVARAVWGRPPPGDQFRRLAEEAERWAHEIPIRWEHHGRPCARRLVDEAARLCEELGPSQSELVICHQDLHGGNVLAAGDGRWLAIDPKPLVGEREFDVASYLRDRRADLLRDANPRKVVKRRLDVLSDELQLDRTRARGWAIAHALAWGLEERTVHGDLLACAELLTAV